MMNLKNDYFDSIENLPLWNWWKIADTDNLIYLYKRDVYEGEDWSLSAEWDGIISEFIDEYGLSNEYQEVLSLKKQWIDKRSEYLLNGMDRFLMFESELIEIDIKEAMRVKIKGKKEDTLIMLEEKLKREIDPKKITVKKCFDYINYYSRK